MVEITWSEKMSVGNSALDWDHKTLLDLLNRFHGVAGGQVNPSEVPALFTELVRYTEYHFQIEERLMRLAGYAELDKHKEMHAALVSRLLAFQSQYLEAPERFNFTAMADFLSDWLVRHILREDMKMGEVLQSVAKTISRRSVPSTSSS
ncbi:hemerythrin [Rhodospirillum rubrum]|uniref:bacteriohemerythrin n=1 Tax=Rhodospirillum rubrum TaxID=1085 RepID=UPI0019081491|nr:bacteriohemerythrin [Rhodospirillum rubrum]MBK1664303.1 hemerythrin [Rhodospirillum rubrum]MBK1677379.1 hemerythrin [Rhodospirillum rubrum]